MTNELVRLTLRGPETRIDREAVEHLQQRYRTSRCVTLPGFIDSQMLEWVRRQIPPESLTLRRHGDNIALELGTMNSKCVGVLTFLVNDPAVLRFAALVTGVPRLTRFFGRVYHRVPGLHHDSWHDDIVPDRLVGLSLNLNVEAFEGGEFQIRDAATERQLGEIANTGTGDAILFAIGEGLEHRMAPLRGSVPKTAYAGWFGDTIDYNGELKSDPSLEK